MMAYSKVVLGLGSNRGDSRRIFFDAARVLAETLTTVRLSSLYRSTPLYVTDQPAFLNAALAGCYGGNPWELLEYVHLVEARFGRDRSRERRRGERTLDIDILLFGDLVMDHDPRLRIPHPGLLERKFALLPLLELEPEAIDPRSQRPLWETYLSLPVQGIYYADIADYNQR